MTPARSLGRAGLVTVLVISALAAASACSSSRARVPERGRTTPATSGDPLAPPARARQIIGYHGVEITVPASWAINNTRCGTPAGDTVVRDEGAVEACLVPRPPNVSSVELLDNPAAWRHLLRHGRSLTNQHAVRLIEGRITQRPSTTIIVPSVNVIMFIDTLHARQTRQIIDSISTPATDVTGCAMHRTAFAVRPHLATEQRRLARALIPSGARSITICHYSSFWLASAATVTGKALNSLVRLADTGPRGYVHAPTRNYLPSLCTDSQAGEKGDQYLLTARYDHDPAVPLSLHIGFCGPLGLTNGIRATPLTEPMATAVTNPLHTGFGLPGRLLAGGNR